MIEAERKKIINSIENFGISYEYLGCDDQPDYRKILCAKYIPEDCHHVLILLSGTHGVELPVGTLLQERFLETFSQDSGVGFVLIHGINPSGALLLQRENSNSVDLNRNFLEQYDLTNGVYSDSDQLVSGKTTLGFSVNLTAKMVSLLLKLGAEGVARELTKGQSIAPYDPYFTGHERQHESLLVTRYLTEIRREQSDETKFLFLDLHSGYGDRGEISILHLYQSGQDKQFQFISDVWSNETVTSVGDIVDEVDSVLGESCVFSGTIEVGTCSVTRVFFGIATDNFFQRISKKGRFHKLFKNWYLKTFSPVDDQYWRTSVISQFDELMPKFLIKFAGT